MILFLLLFCSSLLASKEFTSVAIVKFENKTKNKYYDYIGVTLQKSVYEYLSFYNSSVVSISNSSTNILYFLSPENVNQKYEIYPDSDNLFSFGNFIKTDYILTGWYKFKDIKREEFYFYPEIFDIKKRKSFSLKRIIITKDTLLEDAEKIGNKFLKYFVAPSLYGAVKLNSSISNFVIYIDGIFAGKNKYFFPFVLKGKRLFEIESQKKKYKLFVSVKPNSTNYIEVSIEELKMPVVNITSQPSGAKVYLDLVYYGLTPITITNLPAGEYKLKLLKKDFYPVNELINVSQNTNNFYFNLITAPPLDKLKDIYKNYNLRKWIFLGTGVVFTGVGYFCYNKYKFYYDRYQLYLKSDDLNLARNYYYGFLGSATGGIINFAFSFYNFLKSLEYEEIINDLEQIDEISIKVAIIYKRI